MFELKKTELLSKDDVIKIFFGSKKLPNTIGKDECETSKKEGRKSFFGNDYEANELLFLCCIRYVDKDIDLEEPYNFTSKFHYVKYDEFDLLVKDYVFMCYHDIPYFCDKYIFNYFEKRK